MRKYRVAGLVLAALLVLHALATPSSQAEAHRAGGEKMADTAIDDEDLITGGIMPVGSVNDLNLIDLARFAVTEHNKKANALLEYEKLVKVKQQVVQGTMYYFTIEVKEGGANKLYEAKVWEMLWLDFKELQEFKPVEEASSNA
uniref:Cysteine proteinase inhibitor n=1 Tax=Leersia perrieri TaxID=77586 RepID=A0A0D9V6U9_9ORYZ